MNNKFFHLFVFLVLSSCVSTRNLVYLNDIGDREGYTEEIKNKTEPRIQPDDQLSITVSTLNSESNMLFNSGVISTAGSTSTASATKTNEGYLVDKDGFINFPVLGKVHLAELTKEQATTKMAAEIDKNVKNPIVNIRFINFRITVIGEVNKPSTFAVLNERITLLEALAMAGDLTTYGRRENVMLIRENNGIRTISRIDLADKQFLNSPAFYLQQNDVIYVEPAKIKALQTSTSTFYLSLATASVSLLSLLFIIIRK